ncbi:hypothetical protein [Actinoplanes sp. NPDC051851]|uniref:hypothetical protein n=1 Tax=Actinoplanes sp. NPDC051851 TaxID=3154753 RepID=UPI00342B440C
MTAEEQAGAAATMSAAVDVHTALTGLAAWLRKQPGVTRVSVPLHLTRKRGGRREPAGFALDWYVAVQHESTLDLDFCLEVSYADGEWVISSFAAAGGRDPNGSDRIASFPDRYAVTDQEFLAELSGACRMLTGSRKSILDSFLNEYVAAHRVADDRESG